MKTFFSIFLSIAILIGLNSCESIGVGPQQDSEINFDYLDAEGNAYYPDHLTFSLPQFNTNTPYQNFGAPASQSSDSAWVGRIVSFDTSPMEEVDSLQSLAFSLHFFQKEAKDLLVQNADCNCLDYPDAATFADRFFANGKSLGPNQHISASFRRTFAFFESNPETSQIELKAVKQIDDTLYLKADFEFGFGNLLGVFSMQNGNFQLEIPY